jgi:Flp pilus assembly protein TadG
MAGWEIMGGFSMLIRERFRAGRERGANLVEFAILMPLLLLMLLGIIEFGYFLGEYNDVRHGAREGARLAAVNAGDNDFLHTRTCESMDLTSNIEVQFTDGASGQAGETGSVTVSAAPGSLSGLNFISVFLPSNLVTSIEFRLEQPSEAWGSFGPWACP